MATLTIRIPDDKHNRLKQLAESRGISVNKLMEELATIALTESDTYHRFQIMAARGARLCRYRKGRTVGLRLLDIPCQGIDSTFLKD